MRDSGSGLPAAAISSWMARSAALSITEISYCIFDHLLCFGVPVAGGRSPLLRTAPTRSDTTSRTSFKDFRPPATAGPAYLHGSVGDSRVGRGGVPRSLPVPGHRGPEGHQRGGDHRLRLPPGMGRAPA